MVKVTDKYVLFFGGIFSQFYKSDMIIGDVKYFCCEQYMMAMKAELFKDGKILELIMNAKTPYQCKKLGRKVKNFDPKIWNRNKFKIVYKANLSKFTQNKRIQKELLKYGDRMFVEASPWDGIWGIKLAVDDPKAEDSENWKGQNLLGKAVTQVRDNLKIDS